MAKGIPLMGRDPDGKAKMINVDENGNVKVQQSGTNVQVAKVLTASFLERVFTPEVSCDGAVIQNLSPVVPVEIIINEEFLQPTITTTPDPDTFQNVIRIEPGQVFKANVIVDKISYRSLAEEVPIKIVLGGDAHLSPIKPANLVKDLRVLRYRILGVDSRNETIYANQTSRFFKSTNGGKTWTQVSTFNSHSTEPNAGFVTKAGTILVCGLDQKLYRSTDEGLSFTAIMQTNGSWRGSNGICQNNQDGTIIFGENPQKEGGPIHLYRSIDDGATWTSVLERQTSDIRHFHSVQIDPYTRKWIATTGDTDAQVEWWESDDGVTWTAIVGADSGVAGSQHYRTLGLLFSDDEYTWGTDNPLWGQSQNYILSAKKDVLGTLIKKQTLPAPAYASAQQGKVFFVGTQPEGTTSTDRMARLYISKDLGKTWDVLLCWALRDDRKGGFNWADKNTDIKGNLYFRLSLLGEVDTKWLYQTLKVTL